MLQSIFTCRTYQTFRSFFGHRFHAKRRTFGKAHFSHSHFIMQKTIKLLSFRRTCFPFYTCINIFRIFAENMHIHLLRFFYRGYHSAEPTYGAQTHIQIQRLAQSHIQGTDTTSYRSSQRTFYAHTIFLESLHRLIRQPGTCFVESTFTCQYFHPFYFMFIAIRLLHGCIHYGLHSRSNFHSHSVSCNIRYCLFHLLSCI